MSQQEEERPQRRTRLVFSQKVNEEIQSRFQSALRDRQGNEEEAIDTVLRWLWENRQSEQAAPKAFRQLLDHFIKSALAQTWINRIEGTFRVEGEGEDD
jgi:hypothetical protein